MFKIVDENLSMDSLLETSAAFQKPELGSMIEGEVITVTKNRIILDLNGVTVGVVSGKETHTAGDTMKDLRPGDTIKAVVIDEENEDGMVVLSLKKASQTGTWDMLSKAYKEGTTVEVPIQDANKGGLLIDFDGIVGFLPVSQLAPAHYPRVENANSGEILSRLKKLVGQKLTVKVLTLDKTAGKIIYSEKAAVQSAAKASLSSLKVGDKVKGKVSGVVKFGIFVTFNGVEGLVHISEIAWGHVSDPHQYAKVGDEVEVKLIGIDDDKISLSMKQLTPDPWLEISEKYPIGSWVKGVINRFSQFGAFVQLEDDINGLIHLSEISSKKVEDPSDFLKIGEEVDAMVINIDREEHRIGLSLKRKSKEELDKMDEESDLPTEDEVEAVTKEKGSRKKAKGKKETGAEEESE